MQYGRLGSKSIKPSSKGDRRDEKVASGGLGKEAGGLSKSLAPDRKREHRTGLVRSKGF